MIRSIDDLTDEHIDLITKFDDLMLKTFAINHWMQQYHNVRLYNNTYQTHSIDKKAYQYANESLKTIYETLQFDLNEI